MRLINTNTKTLTKQRKLEQRRLRAARLLLKGINQTEVARRVGVSRSTVCGWMKRLDEDGIEALRIKNPRGRPSSLGPEHQKELKRIMRQSSLKYGFPTEGWSLARAQEVIKEKFGASLSESQVSRIIRNLGITYIRPARRRRILRHVR